MKSETIKSYYVLLFARSDMIHVIKSFAMSFHESPAMKSLEVALDHALARLNELEGEDRIAFASEYKEWLADDELKEKVWFSIPLENTTGKNIN